MTFEEFFKKKRIDLAALEKGNPALFFEFKNHFHQMGEKSFDHTKKYWFNNLRKLYHLAAEIKTEKPKIENQLAEQTITDSLNEPAEPTAAPKLGFVPKFRANVTKPAEETPAEEKKEEIPAATKSGFTPRFKAANMPKPAEAAPMEENKQEGPPPPKLGFTPKFKAANVPKQFEAELATEKEKKEEVAPVEDKPKIGFTPRFKAGVTKSAESSSTTEEKAAEEAPAPVAPKLGFTPKFKAENMPEQFVAGPEAEEDKKDEAPATPKLGFKPKFRPSTPPKSEGE